LSLLRSLDAGRFRQQGRRSRSTSAMVPRTLRTGGDAVWAC